MNYSDFIYDFNLYLCERFGYRNCCSVMHNANGICVSVHVGEWIIYPFLGIQLRRWQYPRLEHHHCAQHFKRNQQENLKDLARFFKEYARAMVTNTLHRR
mgnify:CR=1 FL=1